ncbi:MAG TPA: NAD(P)-dependent oxidoreductase [Myxococcales bacterium]|jgi:NADP-dependent 3-hydroxy acid dehydrogenase YdfG|nr:NAD(P)-dependent oxidoreductase [Myxococcales bacterium]
MNRIEGKRVLITGTSSGIGKACAVAFAQRRASLVLTARRGERLIELAERLRREHEVEVATHVLDVRDRQAVLAFARSLEADGLVPDVLVNNAGLAAGLTKLHEGSFEDWDRMIDTNLKGLLNVSRAVLPSMVARNSGHVVNLGSIAGHLVYPNGNVYNATKFAVRALNEAMNLDLVGTRIRVSSIDPGAVETEFSLVRFAGDEARAAKVYQGYQPLRPEDIAEAVLFVVNAPEHVNVQQMVVMPTAQRSSYVLHREG